MSNEKIVGTYRGVSYNICRRGIGACYSYVLNGGTAYSGPIYTCAADALVAIKLYVRELYRGVAF